MSDRLDILRTQLQTSWFFLWGRPDRPFAETLWWTNRELIHHGAEIALLRDRHRAGLRRPD